MSYHKYDIDDFVNDPFFRKWVLNPNPESNYFWEKWLMKHPDKEKIINEAVILVKALRFKEVKMEDDQKSELFKRIKSTNSSVNEFSHAHPVVRPIRSELRGMSSKNKGRGNLYAVKYAASMLMLMTSVFWFTKDYWMDSKSETAMVVKDTSRGQKTRIFLPDGSTVLLNASSKLTYPEKFSGNLREVYLSGEAFFEVVKDASKPFLVRTDHLVTKVLGTSFNVKAFNYSGEESVALVTGRVEILADKDTINKIILAPGELAGYKKIDGDFVKRKYEYNKEVLWKDGILYFEEMPLQEVLCKLEQWYGVDFTVENMPDKEFPVTGKFENEYLSNVLRSIGYSVKFDFEINGDEVHLVFE